MAEWETIAIGAVFISFGISIVMLLLSRLFQLSTLEQWAKGEMIFAISTVFLLLFLILLVDAGQQIGVQILSYMTQNNFYQATQINVETPAGATMMDYAHAYMKSNFKCMDSIFRTLVKLNAPAELASSFTTDAFMFDIVSGWAYKGPVQTIRNMGNYLIFTFFIYYIFLHIMKFVSATAVAIFIPIGIAMRQFPPTRGAGAWILAFSIGFYLVFPFAYVLVINVVPQTFACVPLPQFDDIPHLAGTGDPDKAFTATLWAEANYNSMMDTLDDIGSQIAGLPTDPLGVVPDTMEALGGRAAGFSINMCCLPFLALIITMSFILSSTNLFGANLPEIGRGFIKLI